MHTSQLLRSTRFWLAAFGLLTVIAVCIAVPLRAAEFDVYSLQHASPNEARRMLKDLADDRADQLHIVVDSQTNELMVRGPQELRDLAREFLDEFDRPAIPQTAPPTDASVLQDEVRSYRIPAGSSNEILQRLKQTLPRNARISTDTTGSRLIVVASPAIHDQVTLQLESIERTADSNEPISRRHVLEQDLRTTSTFSRQATGDDVPFMRLDDVRPQESITPVNNTQRVHEYRFHVRPLQDVRRIIEQLLSDRLEPFGSSGFIYVTPDDRRVVVQFDASQSMCVLSGPDSLVTQFTNLLTSLDASQPEAGEKLRMIPVRNVEPAKLERAINLWRSRSSGGSAQKMDPHSAITRKQSGIQQTAFQQSAPGGQGNVEIVPADPLDPDSLRRPTSDVEIQSLPDLDVIILRGRDADIEELTRIINEIERISAETTPEIELYHLQHVRGESLNVLVSQVIQDLTGAMQGRVSITPLVRPNALLIIGWGEAVEAVKKLVAELDQPVDANAQMRVFPLKNAPAQQVQSTIRQFYSGRQGLAPQIEITADTRTNSVIVNASPRDMLELEVLIQRLDAGESQTVNEVRTIRLQNSLANDIAQTLQAAIVAAQGGGTEPSAVLEMLLVDPEGERVVKSGLLNNLRITPDPRTNSLIVTGPRESMDLIETLIRQLDENPASSAQIKVFQIINSDATETVQMLRTLFPGQAATSNVPQLPTAEGEGTLVPVRFSVDIRTNSIIATGSSGDLRIIEALISRLDSEEAQQRVNEVYRLRNSPATYVAAAVNDFLRNEQNVQSALPGRQNPFQKIETEVVVVAEEVTNSLIISASPRYFDEIFRLVKELDEQPPQVLIQVILAEVELDNVHELGIELGLQDSVLFDRSLLGDLVTTTMSSALSTPAGVVTTTDQVIQAASNTPGFNFNNFPLGNSGSDAALASSGTVGGQSLSHFGVGRTNTELGYGGLVLSASSENVSVLIRALEQTRNVEILSRPQVMTLDNQPAFIQVGERVPRVTATSITQVGQVNTVELEDVGLILDVTPRISPEGMVVMNVNAIKSALGPIADGIPVSFSADGTVIRSPRIKITAAETTVSSASGQTIVIGGLITKDNTSINRKVPWLGDIPILGHLFRYDTQLHNRKELLIILTPHVIRSRDEAEYQKQLEMARMSWCSADFFDLYAPATPPMLHGMTDEEGIPVIFPDQTPGVEWDLAPTYGEGPMPIPEEGYGERLPTPMNAPPALQPDAPEEPFFQLDPQTPDGAGQKPNLEAEPIQSIQQMNHQRLAPISQSSTKTEQSSPRRIWPFGRRTESSTP
ncbi:MAG: hypothetical protein KDA86_01045 [Planctomycetaceae bacterium]|nr:hypothetical protein [Planctomycetaceae bacterium]